VPNPKVAAPRESIFACLHPWRACNFACLHPEREHSALLTFTPREHAALLACTPSPYIQRSLFVIVFFSPYFSLSSFFLPSAPYSQPTFNYYIHQDLSYPSVDHVLNVSSPLPSLHSYIQRDGYAISLANSCQQNGRFNYKHAQANSTECWWSEQRQPPHGFTCGYELHSSAPCCC
jgi:hypothetical protein